MNGTARSKQAFWDTLLIFHMGLYTLLWVLALITMPDWTASQVVLALWWVPMIAVHLFLYRRGRNQPMSDSEATRQAYRDGFADAMRMANEHPESVRHMVMANDGELYDMLEKPKRDDEFDDDYGDAGRQVRH
jgi:hypothetical protein